MITTIEVDKKTGIWVYGPMSCIGHFSKGGIEIYEPITALRNIGRSLYLKMPPDYKTTIDDWKLFVNKMKEMLNVEISDEYMPKWLK